MQENNDKDKPFIPHVAWCEAEIEMAKKRLRWLRRLRGVAEDAEEKAPELVQPGDAKPGDDADES